MDGAIQLRSKINHFNVLVIGRANAGKTTLLKRVCNSIEDPEIFSPEGIKIDASIVEGSDDRGEHDIENRLIFKSNPNFIFHDSRGFESGSVKETEKVKAFIAERAASTHLSQQLHMIWYCLPTDTNRPLLEADKEFFNHSVAGKVPVVAIFTKFDALETKAFTELKQAGLSRREAMPLRTGKALELLTANFIEPLLLTRFNPSDHLHLGNMHKNDSSCKELIEKTANAINDDRLRLLFVSVQQNNIDLSIFYAVESAFGSASLDDRQIVEAILGYFQHSWQDTKYDNARSDDVWWWLVAVGEVAVGDDWTEDEVDLTFTSNVDAFQTALKTRYPRLSESIKGPSGRAEMVAAICICAEQTFTESAATHKALGPACYIAFDTYTGSDLERDVKDEIARILPQDYRDVKEKVVPKLVQIIKTHRLRIKT